MSNKTRNVQSYDDALKYMFEFESSRDDSLETIKRALELFGNPQSNFKVIHIAGTNGKGSVSKMLFSILKHAEKKVGVFTSPHLIDIRERFESDTGIIPREDFIKYVIQISNQGIKLAYFEKCFLISMLYFTQQRCEYVIIETGVGGAFDTTNIVSPVLTCITSISYDHQGLLGDTLDEIAAHKAGIIKPGIPIIINFNNTVIEERAKHVGAPIIFSTEKKDTNLLGEYQKNNAGLALEGAKNLAISQQDINTGLKKVDHTGRLQKIDANILIDGAHNEAGIKQLLIYVEDKEKANFDNVYYCFNVKKGKNPEVVRQWIGKEKHCILLDVSSNYVSESEGYSDNFIIKNKAEILILAKNTPKHLYVIFGSLYLIGEFL